MKSSLRTALLFDKSNLWLEKYMAKILNNFDVFYNYGDIRDYEVVFILGVTKMVKPDLLSRNHLNLVIHESALPEGKGFAPVQWQILRGQNTITVSLIEAADKPDSGDIIMQAPLQLTGYELWPEIREKQALVSIKLIEDFLNLYPAHIRWPQKGITTFFPKRSEKDDELNIDQTLREQFNHLRIANNEEYPLYFIIDGRKYYLKIFNDNKSPARGTNLGKES